MAPSPQVYIIDDDPAVRDSLAAMLEIHGFEVATYGTAQAFLEETESGIGGCVVSDVQMPEMNGLQLLRAVRARNGHVPVLMVTARGGRAMADEAMTLGARAIIDKPFAPHGFVQAVRSALGAGV